MNRKIPGLILLILALCVAGASVEPPELESNDIRIFFDGTMEAIIATHALPGAVVSVVKDGKILLAGGYGYADVDKRIPVNPETTQFRTGSTGKLFTWTAVMQLVEREQIDLDADINTYLGEIRIPDTFPEPVTMKHLMSHSAGFEDRSMGIAAKKIGDVSALGDWLKQNMPVRVRPPGAFSAYSNYGTALAGYIVEMVSGIPYAQYLDQNVFLPLGMVHTTCEQRLEEKESAHSAIPYRFHDGWHDKKKSLIFNGMVPAGAHSTTGIDMARFMLAHLNNGIIDDTRILREDTARRMHSHLFSHDPGIPGNAHGFWEYSINGLRVIAHGGDTLYFHTLMAMIPEKGVGLYLSTHSSGRHDNPRMKILENFIQRYFPAPAENPRPLKMNKSELARFSGTYRVNRSAYTTIEKAVTLVSNIKISPGEKGRLLVIGMGGTTQWIPIAPLKFASPDGTAHLLFRENNKGRITHLFIEQLPHAALEKLNWHQSPGLHLFLLILALFFFVVTMIRWPGRWLLGRVCLSLRDEHAEEITGLPRWLMGLVSLLNLLWFAGFITLFSDEMKLLQGQTAGLTLFQWLPVIASILTIGVILATISGWVGHRWSVCSRIYATLFSLSSLLFIWVLWTYNMLGFKY